MVQRGCDTHVHATLFLSSINAAVEPDTQVALAMLLCLYVVGSSPPTCFCHNRVLLLGCFAQLAAVRLVAGHMFELLSAKS